MLHRKKKQDESDPAAYQLVTYASGHPNPTVGTTSTGKPLSNLNNSVTVGPSGPTVFQSLELIDALAHFNRERTPERVVHAKGAGAFGYFEVTHDITEYTAATVFSAIGKKTNVAVRFSFVAGNLGSADTVRDVRGFAIKFYTEDGNWDVVGNNTPIFFIRDAARFPEFIHSQKRNPVTNIMHDWNMYWDFLSLAPESIHQVMVLYSDRGIPDGYRYMHGYGSNTYSLINGKGVTVYCKFHFVTDQGIKNLDPDKAQELAGSDADYATRDLYNAIAKQQFPSWTFYIQTMTLQKAATCAFDPFDVTKIWPKADYPLKKVGKLVLNRNPKNFFAEVEQLCFSPANLVPGIGPSPDKVLQGRLFAYTDTQRHRIGANFNQIPVNRPFKEKNYQRDGCMTIDNQGGAPNYFPNSFGGPSAQNPVYELLTPILEASGNVKSYNSEDIDNYSQPSVFWKKVLNDGEKNRMAKNIAGTLKNAAEPVRNRMVEVCSKVDPAFGRKVRNNLSNGGVLQATV